MTYYYLVSSKFHGTRILSRHRSVATAKRAQERNWERHGRECDCAGATIVTLRQHDESSAPFAVGYGVSSYEIEGGTY